MTKWLNYDPIVIHANSWRLLQPGKRSIIDSGGVVDFLSGAFPSPRRRHAGEMECSFSPRDPRSELERGVVIASIVAVLFLSFFFLLFSNPILIFVTARSTLASDHFRFNSRSTD
jgi:hypothetical protein